MKTSLKANLLKHLIGKKEEGGFTLIELLVVIIIIGILAAIALPSFLNQANKAKQSEAKTYVGSMNRAQQAYYLENGNFANQVNFNRLGLGIAQSTTNYAYAISGGGVGAKGVHSVAQPGQGTDTASSLKAYGGGVNIAVIGSGTTGEATTLATLCEALNAPVQTGPLTTANIVAGVTVPLDGLTAPSCVAATFKPLN